MSLSVFPHAEAFSSSKLTEGRDRRHELDRQISRLTSVRSLRVVTESSLAQQTQAHSDGPEIRGVFEALGPPFSAAALELATRTDLLPPSLCRELRRTRSSLPEISEAEAHAYLQEQLGAPVADVFLEIEPRPFVLQASIHSYRARLRNGAAVRLDLLHPAVSRRLDADLEAVAKLKPILKRWKTAPGPGEEDRSDAQRTDLDTCLADVRRTIELEADLSHRVADLILLQNDRAEPDAPRIPLVYSDLSTSGALVTEALGGVSLAEIGSPERGLQQPQRQALARRLARVWLRQALAGRPTPRTPHPEATTILERGQIAFEAGGSFRLSSEERGLLESYLHAMSLQDPEAACRILLPFWPDADAPRLLRASRQLMPEHQTFELGPSQHLSTQLLLHERRLAQLGASFPAPMADFFRGLSWIHFSCQTLAPEIDALREGLDHLRLRRDLDQIRRSMRLDQWSGDVTKCLELWSELPQKVDAFLDSAARHALDSPPSRAHLTHPRPGHSTLGARLLFGALLLLLLLLRIEEHNHGLDPMTEWISFLGTLVVGGVLLLQMGEGR